MEFSGEFRAARVRIIGYTDKTKWLEKYIGQECDAILYDDGLSPQLDTTQLNPPLPRYQTVPITCIEEIGKR